MRVSQPVSQIDLVPTLLELLNHKPADHLQGESLLPRLEGKPSRDDHVFIEWNGAGEGPSARCVVSPDGWKMGVYDTDNSILFNRNDDPLEFNNLYYKVSSREVKKRLSAKIAAWQRRTGDKFALAS
jgi:arylsulfatase A-like enzyme